jgi:hypothetical protein
LRETVVLLLAWRRKCARFERNPELVLREVQDEVLELDEALSIRCPARAPVGRSLAVDAEATAAARYVATAQ